MSSWIFLLVAILFEVGGTSSMKLSQGLTRPLPTAVMFLLYGLGFINLSLALKDIDVSVAYAIWSGVGIVLIVLIDMFIFKTHLSFFKLFAIGLILAGAVLLKCLSE